MTNKDDGFRIHPENTDLVKKAIQDKGDKVDLCRKQRHFLLIKDVSRMTLNSLSVSEL